MVNVAQIIPTDPEEQASVLAVLRDHPELREFIQRTGDKADQIFPEARITLDTQQFDEWDPPVRMLVHAHAQDIDAFMPQYHRFSAWLSHEAPYPEDLIQVVPVWAGTLEHGANERT
jgi:hypothetical protein